MKRILAAIDFSDVTNEVLKTAVNLKTCCNSELLIAHIEMPPDLAINGGTFVAYVHEPSDSLKKNDSQILKNIIESL